MYFKSLTVDRALTELKTLYHSDRFHFELNCSMILAGDSQKDLRQDIITRVTGVKMPKSKCGLTKTAEVLKASFEQTTLF